ncbi:SprT-like domain-containing protein [Intrasporangium calvum]|uniref:SprT-like domain-containing protein n=1 Tax=Intrasporangium calvum TaxID=53358 RepID=A0ABT5GDN5_9MICO|nr:SprT-like domain-containing protein [Intrasporangium calvum]MDC5696182.1 SprT-like domain-containing protein [Intrasporangium calvum]
MELSAALKLGRELMAAHGLGDWSLNLDRARTRAGVCRAATREISLSAHLTRLHPEEEVRDTILHEIAHALVGPGHGHDSVWRAKAHQIGCSGNRCSSADVPSIAGDWVGTCAMGHRTTRHRMPSRVALCTRCAGTDLSRVFTWTHRGQRVPMHPNYVAELDALRLGLPQLAPGRLRPGATVRIAAPGQYDGVVGQIVTRGRTRYRVRIPEGLLSVPFAWVERSG